MTIIATDCKLYVDGYDFSSQANRLAMEAAIDIRDATTFGNDTRKSKAGLPSISGSYEGFFESGVDKIDPALFSRVAVNNGIVTMAPLTGAEGETAYSLKGTTFQYSPMSNGAVGDILAFRAAFQAQGEPLIRGKILKTGTVTADGNGTGFNLGAVSSSQKVFMAAHVTGANETDVTISLESDVDNTWGTPTTQITLPAFSAIGAAVDSKAGAITDTWWRVSWAVTLGTAPSFDIVVIVGII